MIRKSWIKIGRLSYWLAWPGLYVMLARSQRTRVVLIKGPEILVVKSWLGNGKWNLPGGGIHKGESAEEALLREVAEETGLNLAKKFCKPLRQATYKQNGLRFPYSLYVCRLKPRDIPLITNREITESAWMRIDELSVRNANSDVITALKAL